MFSMVEFITILEYLELFLTIRTAKFKFHKRELSICVRICQPRMETPMITKLNQMNQLKTSRNAVARWMSRSLANGTGDFRDCQRKNSSTRCLQLLVLDETHGAPKSVKKKIRNHIFCLGFFYLCHFFFVFFFCGKERLGGVSFWISFCLGSMGRNTYTIPGPWQKCWILW